MLPLMRQMLVRAGLAVVDDAAHAPEHSLEVQLPFLQRALDPTPPILPMVVGPAAPEAVKATLAEMRASRRAAQPSGIKTFGSTFKNPDDPRADGRSAGVLLDEAGCRGLAVGGARFSKKHANFVENMGDATTADVIALMGEGRRRVRDRFGVELEPEVQFLGEVDTTPLWGGDVPS